VRSDAAWHRVQVGAYRARRAAEELAAELVASGYAAVVIALPPG